MAMPGDISEAKDNVPRVDGVLDGRTGQEHESSVVLPADVVVRDEQHQRGALKLVTEMDGENIAPPDCTPQNVESSAPISGMALTILTISFTVANFMVALDGSILGA